MPGSTKKNVVPLPSLLSAHMLPPWISTKSLQILKPSPVPPRSRVLVLSALSISCICFYSISRRQHADILAEIRQRG